MKKKTLYLLDMDGTLYLGSVLFPSTLPFLEKIRKSGGKYLFLTNNSSKSKKTYVEKLKKLGIDTTEEEFITSVEATVVRLQKEQPGKLFFVCGTSSLVEELIRCGIRVTTEYREDIEGLLCGFDTELTFQKLDICSKLLCEKKDLPFYATNPDWVCPTEYGYVPDCGSVCEMLYRATGVRPVFIGKPQPDMILMALEKTGTPKEEALLVGDRLYTDIASALAAGIEGAFVLSGEGRREDIEKTGIVPSYVFEDIGKIAEEIK